jgi:hypothetical protein
MCLSTHVVTRAVSHCPWGMTMRQEWSATIANLHISVIMCIIIITKIIINLFPWHPLA